MRWVVKIGYDYLCAGSTWSIWRDEALVFDSKEAAKTRAQSFGSMAKVVRLLKRGERQRERWAAETAKQRAEETIRAAAIKEERARIATWLEAWLSLNERVLEQRIKVEGGPSRDFTKGLVHALAEVAPRIRRGDYLPSWSMRCST